MINSDYFSPRHPAHDTVVDRAPRSEPEIWLRGNRQALQRHRENQYERDLEEPAAELIVMGSYASISLDAVFWIN